MAGHRSNHRTDKRHMITVGHNTEEKNGIVYSLPNMVTETKLKRASLHAYVWGPAL
jgi:hypothetical protein